MKKILLAGISLILCAFMFAACSSNELPDAYDEETVRTASESVVTLLDQKDYSALYVMMDETMQSSLTEQQLASVWEPISEKAGAVKEVSKTSIQGKDGYAVAVLLVKFENGSVQFTISFDEDMKLAGLYMK